MTDSPSVMDLEHFMESFLALRSNQEPRLLPGNLFFGLLTGTTPDRLEKVLDFCSIFMSILDGHKCHNWSRLRQY